ncbi:MAG: hypothetical protein ACLTLQ_08730 [[Clostridium] scindens]
MIAQGAGRPLETVMSSLPMIVSASTSKFVLLAIPFFSVSGETLDMERLESQKLIKGGGGHCVGHIRADWPYCA